MTTISTLKRLHHALGGLNASVIHIAGSKGKGTTAILLAKILEQGVALSKNEGRNPFKKIGLFTSPAILGNEEMIQINGTPIAPVLLQKRLKKVRSLGVKLSEFEALTLAALLHFQEECCVYVALECGWGGREDATNCIEKKKLTILTHVELEHPEVLGKTLSEITRHKLGICQKGVPLFTLPTQPEVVFEEIKKAGIKALIAPAYNVGYHHPESAGLAVMAADLLGVRMDSVIHESLANLVIPGRFEIIPFGAHTLILEGAHTFDSLSYFLERLHEYEREHGFNSAYFGIHILNDKPKDLWKLFPRQETVWVPIQDERASPKPSPLSEQSVREILDQLQYERKPQLFSFCGSFKLVAAVKKCLFRKDRHA